MAKLSLTQSCRGVGGGALPYIAYTGMCRRTQYGFLPLCAKQKV